MKRTNEHRLMKWRKGCEAANGYGGHAGSLAAVEEREERRCEVHRKSVKVDA